MSKKLAQGAIAVTPGTLAYTVPSGHKAEVTNIDICNTTSSVLSLALHLVPKDAAVGTGNMLAPDVEIDGNSMFQWTGFQVLNAGDFIQGIGSGAGLTMNITGNEMRA